MNNADMPAGPLDHKTIEKLEEGYWYWNTGLTKREHFAGLAMQGVLSDSSIMESIRIHDDMITKDRVAGLAVEYADALLKALEES